MKTRLFTDGSCNNGQGAYGVLLKTDEREEVVVSGMQTGTTNNQMELMGVLEGLRYVKVHNIPHAEILADSQYVVRGINEWFSQWELNGFKTAARKPVKNLELWKELMTLYREVSDRVVVSWVRGHDDSPENNKIDAHVYSLTTSKTP